MSASIDTNILIYAVDESSNYHQQAKTFLKKITRSGEPVFICWDVLFSFWRITTNSRIMMQPLDPNEASTFLNNLIALPQVSELSVSQKSWQIFLRLNDEMIIRDSFVTDAVIASILEANAIKKIYSADRDFTKFSYLKPVNPL